MSKAIQLPKLWSPVSQPRNGSVVTLIAAVYPNGAAGIERVDGGDTGCSMKQLCDEARANAEDPIGSAPNSRRKLGSEATADSDITFYRIDLTFLADPNADPQVEITRVRPPA